MGQRSAKPVEVIPDYTAPVCLQRFDCSAAGDEGRIEGFLQSPTRGSLYGLNHYREWMYYS